MIQIAHIDASQQQSDEAPTDRYYRKRTVVEVVRIKDNLYLVKDGSTRYYISKQELEEGFESI